MPRHSAFTSELKSDVSAPHDSQRRFVYDELFARGLSYFLPEFSLVPAGSLSGPGAPVFSVEMAGETDAELHWLGARYRLTHPNKQLTEQQLKLVGSIGQVLSVRYHYSFNADLAAGAINLYRGLPEDRIVSAFLDSSLYRDGQGPIEGSDRIADAIEVLRLTSLMTYENRRITTGALLFGSYRDPCHPLPPSVDGAVPYDSSLTAIRSFHRLCDGLHTVALVDRGGLLVELIEVQQWARPFEDLPLPVPSAAHYQAHQRATLCGGHVFLVLTPNGEIKIFADGVQIFNFLDGRWRLTDAAEKYRVWENAVGDRKLAELIFTVALNLADDRRGCLFVILDDAQSVSQLVAPGDLLASASRTASSERSKQQLHYLLRGKRVLDLPSPVVESVARIDGAIVLDRSSDLLAFGAILQPQMVPAFSATSPEGGRTTAATNASLYGKALKVSEDGLIAFYQDGLCVWEM
jgi:hypothetical protein